MIRSSRKNIVVLTLFICCISQSWASKTKDNGLTKSQSQRTADNQSIISKSRLTDDLDESSEISKAVPVVKKKITENSSPSQDSKSNASLQSMEAKQILSNNSPISKSKKVDIDEEISLHSQSIKSIQMPSEKSLETPIVKPILKKDNQSKSTKIKFETLSGENQLSEQSDNQSMKKKKTDMSKEELQKSRSRYEKIGVMGEDYVCKKPLMTIFSVEGNQYDKAVKATPREKSFCRRNEYTCCSDFNISSVNTYFGKGRRKLRLKFEIIEELFALFRGPKFIEYIQEHENTGTCKNLVSDLSVDIKGHSYSFFSMAYLRHQLEMAENLLMDTEIYTKKVLWFYGDSICAICSPKVQEYFDFGEKTPKIHMHINTCSERIEEREYERNLLLAYDRFISKAVQFIECTQGVLEAEENGDDPEASKNGDDEEEGDKKAVLVPIDEEQQETFLNTFDECWGDQNVANPTCQEFCKINMRQYKFPVNNLFHNLKVSLGVMYSTLTGGNDIEEYYETIKGVEWSIENEDEPIDFFPESNDWKKYKMDEIEWEYHTSTGHNVFKEIMSKKFTEYEESTSRFVSILLVALISLVIK